MKSLMNRVAIVCLAMSLGTAGCSSFLTGNDVINDPNHPSSATMQQNFMAVQAAFFGMQESTLPLTVCMWMQQCTGIGNRFVQQYGEYTVNDLSWSADFSAIYTTGGLVDIRKVQTGARAVNDRVWLGIAQVYEAFIIGTAADLWGDIPYREALGVAATPALDPQMQVYGDVQTLLDSAIVNLGSGAGPGPLPEVDLVYRANTAKWIAAAHTLKARFYIHTAELNGAPAYAAAITEATSGITDTTGDFRAFHGSGTGEGNIWVQFSATTFGQDVVAGKRLVDIMVARSDPRLSQYFNQNTLGGYGGQSVNPPTVPSAQVSALGGTRHVSTFRQPLLTYVENQLILAEAKHATTDDPGALGNLNNARAVVPLVPPLSGITGAALLDSIMTEKYVALFQNIETYNDYRRTCTPALVPFSTTEFVNKVPGRLFYGLAEANANPNIPTSSQQLATNGFRNTNDPAACP